VTELRHAGAQNKELGILRAGMLLETTKMMFEAAHAETPVKLSGASTAGPSLFKADWNFEDLGIGGLDDAFSDIFRRAFSSRTYSPKLVKELGIKHVKWVFLYGPPGTGKTLMARQIGKLLNSVEPIVVNGPEIFSKLVGESEKNIRELFMPAEADEAKHGDASPLHIIIFDEMDAVVRQRGSRSGDTGAGDQVVNQLLSKIDGVDSLNNVLLIGMTNRKDMLDEAILRPGRLEVHIEVGLADYAGRVQIFDIHTKSARSHGRLADDVDIEALAAATKNYTGAEIAGVVKGAASFALSRELTLENATSGEGPNEDNIVLTQADFVRALAENPPALGQKTEDLDLIVAAGMVGYGPRCQDLEAAASLLVATLVAQIKGANKTSRMAALTPPRRPAPPS
jgi:vesicle-fusing ATPase